MAAKISKYRRKQYITAESTLQSSKVVYSDQKLFLTEHCIQASYKM